MFYRAGYIESWGRGIQKICDACKNLGADEPEYIVHGEDIMIKFNALQSAKVPIRHGGGLDGGLADKIIEAIRADAFVTVLGISDAR